MANKQIKAKDIKYQILPAELPKKFDPRFQEELSQLDISKWFYTDYKGNLRTIITTPNIDVSEECATLKTEALTAMQFTDIIRFNLRNRYKDASCANSIFFQPTIICNGRVGIPSPYGEKIYPQEITNQISPYWGSSFGCSNVFDEWKKSISSSEGYARENLTKILGDKEYKKCMGCETGLADLQLIYLTDGAPSITDFGLRDWACLWGDQKTYCNAAPIKFPKLYKADHFSTVVGGGPPLPSGIKTIAEGMMAAIYNYGPILTVMPNYSGVFTFFGNPNNTKMVFTAEELKKSGTRMSRGGELRQIYVIGWGQTPVPHWIVSDGTKIADDGYFRIEFNVMKSSNFFSLYFAPENDMKDFLLPVAKCPTQMLRDKECKQVSTAGSPVYNIQKAASHMFILMFVLMVIITIVIGYQLFVKKTTFPYGDKYDTYYACHNIGVKQCCHITKN